MPVKIFVILIVAFGLSGCVFDENRRVEKSLENSVLEFHQSLNDEKYKEVYERSSERLKSRISEEEFVSQLTQIRSSFYPLPNKAYVFVPDQLADGLKRAFGFTREDFSTFQIISSEKEVTTERFEWSVRDDDVELISYKIDPICTKPCGLAIKK